MASNKVEQVVSDHAHEKSCLVGLEPSATGLVPAKRELALLDPALHIATPVVDPDHLLRWKFRVGYDEAYSGEQFTQMPFDLAPANRSFGQVG